MQGLKKPRLPSYGCDGEQAGDIHAYYGEDIGFQPSEFRTTHQDNTYVSSSGVLQNPDSGYVSFGEYQRNMKLHEVHREQINNVGMATLAGAVGGGAKAAAIAFGAAVYTQCYNACHDQSPPEAPK